MSRGVLLCRRSSSVGREVADQIESFELALDPFSQLLTSQQNESTRGLKEHQGGPFDQPQWMGRWDES